MNGADDIPSRESFAADAEAWLERNATRRPPRAELEWGVGSDGVSVFRNTSPEAEAALVEEAVAWQRTKFDAGYGAIGWPAEFGGAGLPRSYEAAFRALERGFVLPHAPEIIGISLEIEAPTILELGSQEQKERWLRPLRRMDVICCQLFSEPGAGSDLGAISLRADREGDGWVLNGQKVWTSGAQFADLGWVIARTDPQADRTKALTAFVVPMDTPGVTVRPLRQMSGGTNFNEVFFDDVHVADEDRVGPVGAGWSAMMTTLGFERASSEGSGGGPNFVGRLLMTAKHFGRLDDPLVRQAIANVHARNRMRSWTAQRAAAGARAAGGVPGPEGSAVKLAMTGFLREVSEAATMLLGPSLAVDTGEWGTFAWSELVCGFPGTRIGGGTDEIQKNTIAERVLGLPREPKAARS
ncbi:acyl-CoA dehydrogenase family protein [Amycolatopsis jejuensis]|uniref:acyl-CoA dehydrogenase family protein n=1 Tax=Amycolatopsis jejuensis TaxID=330084 RepID=UPI000691BDA0|nr:acyl-CoA dehydrogenase family protein [Amycolatopsis jejuensis]